MPVHGQVSFRISQVNMEAPNSLETLLLARWVSMPTTHAPGEENGRIEPAERTPRGRRHIDLTKVHGLATFLVSHRPKPSHLPASPPMLNKITDSKRHCYCPPLLQGHVHTRRSPNPGIPRFHSRPRYGQRDVLVYNQGKTGLQGRLQCESQKQCVLF